MTKYLKIYFIAILFLTACSSRDKSPIDKLYSELQTKLKPKYLIEFTKLPPQSVIDYDPFYGEKNVVESFQKLQENKAFFDEDARKKKIPSIDYMDQFLVNFHLTLNKIPIDSSYIRHYFYAYNQEWKIRNELDAIKSKRKRLKYISRNWKKYDVDDVIYFELPIKNKDNKNIITNGTNGQLEMEEPNYTSSIELKGRLLKKHIWNIDGVIDTINARFDIKLDSVGQDVYKALFFGDTPSKCIKGDTFKLSLELYGNRIMN